MRSLSLILIAAIAATGAAMGADTAATTGNAASTDPVCSAYAKNGCPIAKALINNDADKNGVVNASELATGMKSKEEDASKIIVAMDTDKDASISLTEYKAYVANMQKTK